MWIYIAFTLFALLLARTFWRRWKYDLHKIPSPPDLPVIGQMLEFSNGQASKQLMIWLRKQLKALNWPKILKVVLLPRRVEVVFQIELGMMTFLFVMDWECLKSVVRSAKNPLPKVDAPDKTGIAPILGIDKMNKTFMMTALPTEYVKAVRKLYAMALQMSQLRLALPKIQNLVDQMIQKIESERKQGPVDFQKLCVQFSLDTIGIVAFEKDLGGLNETTDIISALLEVGFVAREVATNSLRNLQCTLFPNSNHAKERKRRILKMCEEWDKVTKHVLDRPDPPEGETPLWYNLRTFIDPETNEKLPYEILRNEVASIIFAGMDTTGHQISWIFGMLASHPDIANKLVQEMKEYEIYDEAKKDVTLDVLGRMPYLNATIKEGFRLAGVTAFSFSRELPRDMTFAGYYLPKGTVFLTPGNRAMNSEMDWGDPDVVRPERWLRDEDMSGKFFEMFHSGPRDCPGQKLAMLEIRLAIVLLLSKYVLSSEKTFSEMLDNAVDGVMIECKGGMLLNVSPREEADQRMQNASKCEI